MKAIIEFELPKDLDEFTLAQKGGEFFSCLWGIDQEMRSCLKHGHKYETPEEVMEYIRAVNDRNDKYCYNCGKCLRCNG